MLKVTPLSGWGKNGACTELNGTIYGIISAKEQTPIQQSKALKQFVKSENPGFIKRIILALFKRK